MCHLIVHSYKYHSGLGSSVSIVTELWVGWSRIESQWWRDFSPVQTGPGAHPASCTMGTGSFPGVKCGWGVLLTTHPFLVPQSWRVELYLYPPSGPHWACKGITLPLYLLYKYRTRFFFFCAYCLVAVRQVGLLISVIQILPFTFQYLSIFIQLLFEYFHPAFAVWIIHIPSVYLLVPFCSHLCHLCS